MIRWLEPPSIKLTPDLIDMVGGNRRLARILAQRGITTSDAIRSFIDPNYYKPAAPTELPDLEKAVDILRKARIENIRLCVWGDFDVDGQTATALLVDGLQKLGYDVFYYIPDRATESHGLNKNGIRTVIGNGAELILTCDCGVANLDEIKFAYQQGIKVIVTDHHELLPQLPQCEAIVNPQRLPDGHPLRYLAGVGVAYMLMKTLYEVGGQFDQVEQWLDLVALGTIADVALLHGDNRYLVQRGLPKLIHNPRPSIAAILETAEITPSELLETEIVGFVIGPRLNAVGRLALAEMAVELLLSTNEMEIYRQAAQLDIYNERRKQLCTEVEEDAEKALRYQPQFLQQPALVLSGTDWHPGVIGIVASRLVERYNKPTILISTSPEENLGRASARSMEWLHLQDAIFAHQDLLLSGGGHAMAAGFKIKLENIPQFRKAFLQTVEKMMPDDLTSGIQIDDVVELSELNIDFVHQIYKLAPFGAGNPKPIFVCRNVKFTNIKRLGISGAHTRLLVTDRHRNRIAALWWGKTADELPTNPVDIAFTIGLNEYQGLINVQLVLIDAKPHQKETTLEVQDEDKIPYEIIDHRLVHHRMQILKQLIATKPGLQIWAEGDAAQKIPQSQNRLNLEPANTLAIWTIPPGPKELRYVLNQVNPQSIYLLTKNPTPQTLTEWIQTLSKKIKLVLNEREGKTSFLELAVLLNHREATIHHGLELLAKMGKLRYFTENNHLYIEKKSTASSPLDPQQFEDEIIPLANLIQETAAYQRYFSKTNIEDLFLND